MAGTEKNSMLCPGCRKLISSDEPACPYCGLARPGTLRWLTLLRRVFPDPLNWVKAIIYVNVVFFILSLFLNPSEMGFTANPMGLLAPSNLSLFALGASGSIPVYQYGRWWTLISASFLHGGILHIFFNMAALSQLGPFIIQEFGANRFMVIYIVSGVAGFFLSLAVGVPFTIGASAGICGLIGAILYYGRSQGGFYGQAIYKQAMGWIAGLVIFGLLIPGINNWAHGGGVLAGLLLGFLLGYRDRRAETVVHRTLGLVTLLLTLAVLLWAVIGALLYVIR
jgi:rhomboid protease GluP